ncbi:hypothetical protein HDV02_002993 [Globomyces sp. JEL0801]|nr:hypothetical protein HDV02_002993 [Globomyces sp. JEL0801]
MSSEVSATKLFEEGCKGLKEFSSLKSFPAHWPVVSIQHKLLSYAFFKQAKKGPCKGDKPEWWDATSRYKYEAWKKLGDMSEREAKLGYIKLVIEILTPITTIPQKEIDTYLKGLKNNEQREQATKVLQSLPPLIARLSMIDDSNTIMTSLENVSENNVEVSNTTKQLQKQKSFHGVSPVFQYHRPIDIADAAVAFKERLAPIFILPTEVRKSKPYRWPYVLSLFSNHQMALLFILILGSFRMRLKLQEIWKRILTENFWKESYNISKLMIKLKHSLTN